MPACGSTVPRDDCARFFDTVAISIFTASRLQQVTAFLDGSGVRPSTWSGKRGTLQAFFEYWTARGRLKSSPLPPSAPKTTQSFVPYIYSRSDLRSLLDAVPRCQRVSACVMSEATFRTLLLFLYGTGMRLGEALRLRLMDVDLRSASLRYEIRSFISRASCRSDRISRS